MLSASLTSVVAHQARGATMKHAALLIKRLPSPALAIAMAAYTGIVAAFASITYYKRARQCNSKYRILNV